MVTEADAHVERARRLLSAYRSENERLSELLDGLKHAGVEVSPEGETIERLLEQQRAVFESADEAVRNRGRGPEAQKFREVEERYKSAGGTDDRPLLDNSAFGGGPRIRQAALEGVRFRDGHLRAGESLLADALSEIREAINVSRGETKGSTVHPEAQRVEGLILAAQAERARREGQRQWDRAGTPRDLVVALATEARRLDTETRLIAESEIDARLSDLNEAAAALTAGIAEAKSRVETLDATIAGLRSQIDEWNEKAAASRQTLDRLDQEGADLLDRGGTDSFVNGYAGASGAYREALKAAQELEFGTLTDARIDDSGDLVRGRFVPADGVEAIGVRRGAVDYMDDRAAAALDLQGLEEALADVTARVGELTTLRGEYERRADDARRKRDEVVNAGAAAFEAYAQSANQAETAMADAMTKARQSVTSFKSAKTVAESGRRGAGERVSEATPEQKERSPFNARSEAGWRTGQVANEYGQARLLFGRIEYERSVVAAAAFEIATLAKSELGVAAADPDAFAVRRDESRSAALEAVRDAIGEFERSSRDLNGNWTVAAQAADAHYLMGLLESPTHVRSAIENYQAAVNTRESEPYVRPLVERLAVLRSR